MRNRLIILGTLAALIIGVGYYTAQTRSTYGRLESINTSWNKYTNEYLAFSIMVPKTMWTDKCVSDNGESKYFKGLTDVIVVEMGNYVRIGPNNIAVSNAGNCHQVALSKATNKELAQANSYTIYSVSVSGTEGIDKYLKSINPGCRFIKIYEDGTVNYGDINGQTGPESYCFVGALQVIYNQQNGRLLSYYSHQAPQFFANSQFESFQDVEMLKSLSFL